MPDTQAITVGKKVEPGLQTPTQTSEPKGQLEEDQSRGPTHSAQVINVLSGRTGHIFSTTGKHVVVIKTVKLNLKKCECTSGSDCGFYDKIKTHTRIHTHTHTQLLIMKLCLAGFKALVPEY